MFKVLRAFTSVGFVGRIPGAPGTYGSIVAVLMVYLWQQSIGVNLALFLGLILLVGTVGIFASTAVSKGLKKEDPGEIVIDELVGQWIALIAIPAHWGYWLAAFLLFRLFDIWKPGLIDRVQHLPDGLGIMMDDVLAGVLALVIIQGMAAWL